METAVVGAGSWGTALARLLADKGVPTLLWGRRPDFVRRLAAERVNEVYLPGVPLPAELELTSDLERVARCEYLVLAVPTGAQREMARAVAGGEGGRWVLSAAKGYEPGTRCRLSAVLAEEFPAETGVAVLAGPSHAEEVGRGIPTSVVVGATQESVAVSFQNLLHTSAFRVYTNTDLLGVETAAALKNVIAIAAGICDGLGFGDNTKGALVTRGLAEISRLGKALGANPETFFGLAGIGDLVTTCTSPHSRNRRVGELAAQGLTAAEAMAKTGQACEGVETTRSALAIAAPHGVELPITEQVAAVLFGGKAPAEALADLMGRDAKPEVR